MSSTNNAYITRQIETGAWRARWDLLAPDWIPADLEFDGTHWHLSAKRRIATYQYVASLIRRQFPGARIGLCKETHAVRRTAGACNAWCNCLR